MSVSLSVNQDVMMKLQSPRADSDSQKSCFKKVVMTDEGCIFCYIGRNDKSNSNHTLDACREQDKCHKVSAFLRRISTMQ